MSPTSRPTVWVLGDQLDPRQSALAEATPATHRLIVVESDAKLAQHRWHVQRAHLVLTSLRRFTAERRAEGWEVDHRVAPSLAAGLAAYGHRWRYARVTTEAAATAGAITGVPGVQYIGDAIHGSRVESAWLAGTSL